MKLLLKSKPDLNVRNLNGNTALILAASTGHSDTVHALLAGGADPNLRNRKREQAVDLLPNSSTELKTALQEKMKANRWTSLFR